MESEDLRSKQAPLNARHKEDPEAALVTLRAEGRRGEDAQLIEALQLRPHPEGGYFRRLFRSEHDVHPCDGRPRRAALTTIYFLLPQGECSRWHRVRSDEVWHFYQGAGLELHALDPRTWQIETTCLGALSSDSAPVRVIPAGYWQAARATGGYALVGCTVAPGFDFADFEMLSDDACAAAELRRRLPHLADLL